jgi:hypothetical protein
MEIPYCLNGGVHAFIGTNPSRLEQRQPTIGRCMHWPLKELKLNAIVNHLRIIRQSPSIDPLPAYELANYRDVSQLWSHRLSFRAHDIERHRGNDGFEGPDHWISSASAPILLELVWLGG